MKHLKKLGLAVVAAMATLACAGAGAASATTLEVGGATQNKPVSIGATLKAGTSSIIKDKNGTTFETCTSSELKTATEGSFTGLSVGGMVSSFSFAGCNHTKHVLKPGSLSITWSAGTNGTVSSSGAEWTTMSTVFGASFVCKTGTGTTIGTLTGSSSGNATLHINATTLDCGAFGTSSWTGTYTVTSPLGLGVVS